MTFPETTTPSTDPETALQACGGDPLDIGNIPDFLRRSPSKTKRRQQPRSVWRMTPAMKAAAPQPHGPGC